MKWILLFLPSIAKETLSGLKENLNGLSGATKVVNKSTSDYKQPGPVESFFFHIYFNLFIDVAVLGQL